MSWGAEAAAAISPELRTRIDEWRWLRDEMPYERSERLDASAMWEAAAELTPPDLRARLCDWRWLPGMEYDEFEELTERFEAFQVTQPALRAHSVFDVAAILLSRRAHLTPIRAGILPMSTMVWVESPQRVEVCGLDAPHKHIVKRTLVADGVPEDLIKLFWWSSKSQAERLTRCIWTAWWRRQPGELLLAVRRARGTFADEEWVQWVGPVHSRALTIGGRPLAAITTEIQCGQRKRIPRMTRQDAQTWFMHPDIGVRYAILDHVLDRVR